MNTGIHTIAVQERTGTTGTPVAYEMRYEASEMEEVFTEKERTRLAEGHVVIRASAKGSVRYVDATVVAQRALNASFGD